MRIRLRKLPFNDERDEPSVVPVLGQLRQIQYASKNPDNGATAHPVRRRPTCALDQPPGLAIAMSSRLGAAPPGPTLMPIRRLSAIRPKLGA